jgi:RNA polymerase sigma-70 factor (ECF subfamily)
VTWLARGRVRLPENRPQASNAVSDSMAKLYERYGPLVHRRAHALLGDDQAAWDALQEVFLRALRGYDAFRHKSSPTTWLYRITTNYCLNFLRDEMRHRDKLRRRANERPTLAPAEPELRLALMQVLAQLPNDVCEMAVYSHVDRMSHDENAAVTGVSPRTVGNRLKKFAARARGVLAIPEVA